MEYTRYRGKNVTPTNIVLAIYIEDARWPYCRQVVVIDIYGQYTGHFNPFYYRHNNTVGHRGLHVQIHLHALELTEAQHKRRWNELSMSFMTCFK